MQKRFRPKDRADDRYSSIGPMRLVVATFGMVILIWLGAEAWRMTARDTDDTAISSVESPTSKAKTKGGIQRPVALPADGYVTSDSCQECHPDQYTSWHRSYHRTMTQVTTPETFMGSVGETLTRFGSTYGVERRGDKFWGFQTQGGVRSEKQIVMTTGSHHMQVCWYEAPQKKNARGSEGYTDRTLGQFPLVYLAESKRWVPRTSVFLQPPSNAPPPNETGRWNMSCIRCHATHGRPNDWDSRVAEFGISCEACHGPAEQHVAFHHATDAGRADPAAPKPDVVNPADLDSRASAQVCGQCHGVWELATQDQIEQWNHRGFPYRPGDDLHAHRVTYHAGADLDSPELKAVLERDPGLVRDTFWPDGMVRVSGREYNGLMGAPCFQANQLNCLHCHSLHPSQDDTRDPREWANDQLAVGMEGDRACIQCHTDFQQDQRLASHSHHQVQSSGSRCYNCHMPYTTYGLLKAIRSHHISSPDVRESVTVGRPNACNQCHLDQSLGWAADHLADWYDTTRPNLDQQQESVAASVLWTTRGDAGQRALVAWNFGWEAARKTSGEDWIAPYLTLLIADSYDAVRYIACRSLNRLAGYGELNVDFLATPEQLVNAQDRALKIWKSNQQPDQAGRERLLMDTKGNIDFGRLQQLIKSRDNRPVFLAE